jgi:protein CpxP
MTFPRSLAASAFAVVAVASSAHAQGPDLQRLRDDLHLSPAQEPAWTAFAQASAPDPNQQARERSAEQMMPTLTSPKRVQLSIAVMEADLQSLRERGQALTAFYSTLSPEQRAVFDRDTLPNQEGGEAQP